MSISTVNYRRTFHSKLDLTRILGILTYDALHQMQLELKSKALSVHFNLGGRTHRHIRILITNTKYTTLSPVPYVRTRHPGILIIHNNTSHVISLKLTWQSTWSRISSDPTSGHSRWRETYYFHEESYYHSIHGKHMSDFCVPPLNVQKNISN